MLIRAVIADEIGEGNDAQGCKYEECGDNNKICEPRYRTNAKMRPFARHNDG